MYKYETKLCNCNTLILCNCKRIKVLYVLLHKSSNYYSSFIAQKNSNYNVCGDQENKLCQTLRKQFLVL